MTDPSSQLDDLVEAFLAHLEGDGPEPNLAEFPSNVRSEAEVRFEMLRAAHGVLADASGSGASRIAARFGLDRAGQQIDIAGAKVKRVRMSKKRDLADVARAVQQSGVDLTSAQLFRIETAAVIPVDQRTVTALVAVLRCSVDDLETVDTTDLSPVRTFINSDEFRELIARWATEHDLDAQVIARRAGDQLLAAHYRAEDVTRNQLRDILQAILRKLGS
jgi:hypothetical protein